jgi:hypothetical protein
VVANLFFRAQVLGAGTSAIRFQQTINADIAMNVVYGWYTIAMNLIDVEGTILIEHNSVYNNSMGGTGIHFDAATTNDRICYRNNIAIAEDVLVIDSNTRFGCPIGPPSERNVARVTASGGVLCVGDGMGSCTPCSNGAGPLCDLSNSPAGYTDGDLCLGDASDLIDFGIDVGRDMRDGDPAFFNGAGPDVGARESGTQRDYGAISSTCP